MPPYYIIIVSLIHLLNARVKILVIICIDNYILINNILIVEGEQRKKAYYMYSLDGGIMEEEKYQERLFQGLLKYYRYLGELSEGVERISSKLSEESEDSASQIRQGP